MADSKTYPALKQSTQALQQSADLANVSTQKTGRVPLLTRANPNPVLAPPKTKSGPGLWISIFFDGTGNNLEADREANEHSNVARLFLAHEANSSAPQECVRVYVPGLGTLFKDIGDEGGAFGNGFGGHGEARLDWAMKKFEQHIQYSSAKDCAIYLALFGFSRGATLARAFARRIADRCARSKEGWRFNPSGRPIELYFMGLFDTVASVGLAMSANNGGALGQASTRLAMANRIEPLKGDFSSPLHVSRNLNSPVYIATGDEPGADPASGPANGHMAWAGELRIPSMVGQCVHMVAAHEIRNSFPLDSTLDGQFYPSNCVEIVFPGAHSDVGGGYRPGEGARSQTSGALLSLIPLQQMWQTALMAGVPLQAKLDAGRQKDFGMDSHSMKDFPTLTKRFNHYMTALKVGTGDGPPLGKQVLAHMKLYYQWRFQNIARNRLARKSHNLTRDEIFLSSSEPRWAAEKAQLTQRMERLKKEGEAYSNQAASQSFAEMAAGQPPSPEQITSLQQLHRLAARKKDEYLQVKAMADTVPGSDGSLAKNLRIYDEQLMLDASLIKALSKFKKLRPHYKALLEAYEDEFEKGKGLRDPELIAFFDNYVHDSLAGFAGDATLPSDPRVIYIAGNSKLKYAMLESSRSSIADLA